MEKCMEPTKDNLLSYLDQVLDLESRKLVGKLLKKFEVFFPDLDDTDSLSKILIILKRDIKELVYESARDTKDIFYAYKNGLEMSQFDFKKKE